MYSSSHFVTQSAVAMGGYPSQLGRCSATCDSATGQRAVNLLVDGSSAVVVGKRARPAASTSTSTNFHLHLRRDVSAPCGTQLVSKRVCMPRRPTILKPTVLKLLGLH